LRQLDAPLAQQQGERADQLRIAVGVFEVDLALPVIQQ
jgi:hypothetical protein